jgi:sensor histidine kinase YesM
MESTVRRLMEGIEQAKTAEMKQLQAQFNPHFLRLAAARVHGCGIRR